MNFVGKTFNGYKFVETLGSGSFGAVYRVERLGQYFAAKVLSETYILQEFQKDKNRITHEIEVLKNVNHDCLVKYEDDFHFEDDFGISQYVIVMEYFNGITLDKFLAGNRSEKCLEKIFLSILDGVRSLHDTIINGEGVIHRDLKPANILINSNEEIKIIDYGLSKIIDFSSITSTGTQIGSPLYMSPEQLKDSKHIDYRSDIYSLGIILYQMLTNNVPYKAKTIPELFLKIINEPIMPPKQFNSAISDDIERIIYKATAKEPFARFQTAFEFKNAFLEKKVVNSLDTIRKYYAWIYKEKNVTINFEKENKVDIIYPIHVRNWSKGLHKYFQKKDFENVIIDPSTQRLSYFAFANTVGLVELPYAPQKDVISLKYLLNPINRNDYLNKWYDTVSEGHKLILPYHYISNTEYPVDQAENWIKINIQLIDESIKLLSADKKKYAMISIGLNNLVFDANRVLSYYVHADVDAFIVQVSDMRKINGQSLASYIEFMLNLQKYTNKPVIGFKVPIALGLTLVAKGVHGFSLGMASIDYFDEEFIKEEKEPFNTYAKFYFPQVLSFLTYPKKDAFEFQKLYEYFGSCDCCWCNGKSPIEIATGDIGSQLHFWQKMIDEVECINALPNDLRLSYISDRIEKAIVAFEKIPSKIMSNPRRNDYYKLLKYLEQTLQAG